MFSETAALAVLLPDALKMLRAVVALIHWLGQRNDAKALADFHEAMDELTVLNSQRVEVLGKETATNTERLDEMDRLADRLVELVVRPDDWKGREKEKPTKGDVVARAEQFGRAALTAGSHGKRKILWNAFFSTFKPEFYAEGWSLHLAKIAEQIEYPECRWLAEMIEKNEYPSFNLSDTRYFFAQRLSHLGLVTNFDMVSNEKSPLPRIRVFVIEVGHLFKKFVWDEEMCRDEKPQGSGNGTES